MFAARIDLRVQEEEITGLLSGRDRYFAGRLMTSILRAPLNATTAAPSKNPTASAVPILR